MHPALHGVGGGGLEIGDSGIGGGASVDPPANTTAAAGAPPMTEA
jgi:hypothetical protein